MSSSSASVGIQLPDINKKICRIKSFAGSNKAVIADLTAKYVEEQRVNAVLRKLLSDNGIDIPEEALTVDVPESDEKTPLVGYRDLLPDGSVQNIQKLIDQIKDHLHFHPVSIVYENVNYYTKVSEKKIKTVGTTLKNIFCCGSGPTHRVDIIKNVSGRIQRGKITLVMGPPGSGKTTFLKAISGQLKSSKCTLEGTIKFNGDTADCGKFILQKVVNFVSELEVHNALYTVFETFAFAFRASTGGHHSYAKTQSAESAAFVNVADERLNKVNDILTVLGLNSCKDTYVGDAMIRGVSGGQKRRVTVGEMLLLPGEVKVMDSISSGLDAATTFDIIRALKLFAESFKACGVISLLQPAPEVFNLFDDLILFSQGQIIYHGPIDKVLEYFEGLGYVCPDYVDVADFLQEVSMPEGGKYISSAKESTSVSQPPIGASQLAAAWKESTLYKELEEEMASILSEKQPEWLSYHNEPYAASLWYYIKLLLDREVTILKRDLSFLKSRIAQAVLVGGIVSTLFTNLKPSEAQIMGGFLFFSCLQSGLGSMSLIPTIFAQKAVFYKQFHASFFPASAFVLAQSLVMLPLQIAEVFLFGLITYFSVGMSEDDNGGRFFLFMLTIFCFGLCISQIFRLVACLTSDPTSAQPICGVYLVLMVLFSGYIIPKNGISDGWMWFYWINPLAYALKGVTVNEFLGSEYDQLICADYPSCTQFIRLGDSILEGRGNPTDQIEVWYSVIFLFGVYFLGLILTTLALKFIVIEPQPISPEYEEDDNGVLVSQEVPQKEDVDETENENMLHSAIIPFEPVTFSFKDVWYTVKLKDGEELDLLRAVDGYFEPGTVTALMGSSGAGKTTLLDVLAGRKNTGTISGHMSVNGSPKEEHSFRKVMAYVEQFDSLNPTDTAREAIEFSAMLRLPLDTPADSRASWVQNVIDMLELNPIENHIVGRGASGFSFEQRKRLSIGVELAANPSILFLDEPTTGLDSRAAQVTIRSIKRVASSGRSVVCTIHQPSVYIFNSFDSLLLLRRGGQTVYYGDLGENCVDLISYFESVPEVTPCGRQNPAVWMLDLIGAGTGSGSGPVVDFHEYYKKSTLCQINTVKVNALSTAGDQADNSNDKEKNHAETTSDASNAYWVQFIALLKRGTTAYWRNPDYNFVRMVISIIIALIFGSAFANYEYTTDVDTISLAAVMYITSLFLGVVAMNTVQSVTFDERPAFYREQQSEMYAPFLYVFTNTLVEIPYIIVSALVFTIPFYFIVGLNDDDVASQFIWFWGFIALLVASLVFAGQFFAVLLPNIAAAGVLAGLFSTIMSLFGGFMVPSEEIPPYWLFLYYANPLHYVLEGLYVTQFRHDDTPITLFDGEVTTAETYISSFFSEWKFHHRYYDVLALLLFIGFFRIGTYLCLKYISHQKN